MSIYDENLEDEALWLRLMEFLPKELVIQQEKSLIRRNSMFLKPEFSKLKNKPPIPRTSFLAQNDDLEVKTNASDDIPCFFCNEIGHIKTGGPSGSHKHP